MPKRAVFEATDSQLERMNALDLQEKRLGSYAADAFEEWLKRRDRVLCVRRYSARSMKKYLARIRLTSIRKFYEAARA